MPYPVEPMLAVPGELPHDGSRYELEVKWDGIPAILYTGDADTGPRRRGRRPGKLPSEVIL